MAEISLSQVKQHLRVDGTVEDDLITLYLSAAKTATAEYLGREVWYTEAQEDASDDEQGIAVNDAIVAAILLQTATMYAHRETLVTGVTVAEMPHIRALLDPYRARMGV
jgi:uncharacterized phage protein (predicted DNA packaging)